MWDIPAQCCTAAFTLTFAAGLYNDNVAEFALAALLAYAVTDGSEQTCRSASAGAIVLVSWSQLCCHC